MIRSHTDGRVRVITLDRPDALNAFNEALYDAATEELLAAAADPGVAVAIITGEGRAFSAGTDLLEMAARQTDPNFTAGVHGFPGMVQALIDFPKPLICAVNGLALGIGTTMLGFADLVFVSTEAKVRCPFTNLGVAPEAASSFTFPQLLGRQRATWMLLSSEWFSGEQCVELGLALQVCAPAELLPVALHHAKVLAGKPISSLVTSKRTIVEPLRAAIADARHREDAAFQQLLGGPANLEALAAFAERRDPDFASIGD
jgi:enoyl-CoA hydratase/carnithine racemase